MLESLANETIAQILNEAYTLSHNWRHKYLYQLLTLCKRLHPVIKRNLYLAVHIKSPSHAIQFMIAVRTVDTYLHVQHVSVDYSYVSRDPLPLAHTEFTNWAYNNLVNIKSLSQQRTPSEWIRLTNARELKEMEYIQIRSSPLQYPGPSLLNSLSLQAVTFTATALCDWFNNLSQLRNLKIHDITVSDSDLGASAADTTKRLSAAFRKGCVKLMRMAIAGSLTVLHHREARPPKLVRCILPFTPALEELHVEAVDYLDSYWKRLPKLRFLRVYNLDNLSLFWPLEEIAVALPNLKSFAVEVMDENPELADVVKTMLGELEQKKVDCKILHLKKNEIALSDLMWGEWTTHFCELEQRQKQGGSSLS